MESQDAMIIKELIGQVKGMQLVQNAKAKAYAESTNTAIKKLESRVEHLDECFDKTREEVRLSTERIEALVNQVADSIPNRDFMGHNTAHQKYMKQASDSAVLWMEAKKSAVKWAVPIAMASMGGYVMYLFATFVKGFLQ